MASAYKLQPGEERICWYCEHKIKNTEYADHDPWYVVVGEPENTWHVECADSMGIPIEKEGEDDHDPDFDHDPDYDGPREGDE